MIMFCKYKSKSRRGVKGAIETGDLCSGKNIPKAIMKLAAISD